MEWLEFVLGGFWQFVGFWLLVATAGTALIGAAAGIGRFRLFTIKISASAIRPRFKTELDLDDD